MEGNQEQLLEQLNQEGRLLGKYTILSSIFFNYFLYFTYKSGLGSDKNDFAWRNYYGWNCISPGVGFVYFK